MEENCSMLFPCMSLVSFMLLILGTDIESNAKLGIQHCMHYKFEYFTLYFKCHIELQWSQIADLIII